MVVPFLPDPEKLRVVREAIPALSAGIYLNTGSVGPLPAETAAAMADMAAYERDVGRAHEATSSRARADGGGAERGSRRWSGPTSIAVALTHATTDGMNAATMLPDWRGGGRAVTTAHEHAGATGPLYALRDRYGVDVAFVDAGDDGDDERTLAAFDAAITPGTRLVSISHVLWTTGAVLPDRPDRGTWRTTAVRSSWSTGRRPPVPSRSASRSSVPTPTPCPAQKWLLGPEGMGALVVSRATIERLDASARWLVRLRAVRQRR